MSMGSVQSRSKHSEQRLDGIVVSENHSSQPGRIGSHAHRVIRAHLLRVLLLSAGIMEALKRQGKFANFFPRNPIMNYLMEYAINNFGFLKQVCEI